MNAKKVLTLLLSILMVLSCLSAVMVVSADETADKFAPTNEETLDLYEGEQSAALGGFGNGQSVAVKVTVPAGKRLTQLNFPALATYNNNTNKIEFAVYQWDTNYSTTVKGNVLGMAVKNNQVDNAPLDVVFPTNRNMTGELLIVATYRYETSQMTPWAVDGGAKEGAVFYANGVECAAFRCGITIGDELTVQPASYTATFVADGTEVAKVSFLEGDTMLFNIPEVPAKEGFWGDWAAYTLGNADITIEAVYTDASGAIKPEIADAANVTAFAEDHITYLKGKGCSVKVNRDGSVSFTGNWDVDGDVDAYATINYLQLMQKHFEGFNSKSDLPNKSHKYKVVAVKVKAPAVALDSTPNMTVIVGRNTEIYGVEVANAIKCDGNEEYWIFDFTNEKDFYSDVINSMEINWAYSVGEEANLGAEFTLLGFQFFDTLDEAMNATGGEETTEAPTEEKTEAPTEEVTEAPTAEQTTAAPTEEVKEGCGSVIGFSAAAVLAAAAAVVALKKKD